MAISTTKGVKRYDDMYTEYANAQDASAQKQIEQATASANDQLRQAYISRMQNQQQLNDALVQQGIRGGATETSNLALQTNYQNNRSNIYKNRDAAITEINTNADQNKLNFKLQNDAAKAAYIENIEAESREVARADADEKKAAMVDAWTAKYSKYYSIDSLTKALSKAKTSEEKAIINARIGYLRSHKRGY